MKRQREYDVCPYCNLMITDDNLQLHMQFCIERPVKHRSCGIIMPLSQLDLHKQSCSPSTIVRHSDRKRIAFIIGMNSYEHTPLQNPHNDAKVLADTLRKIGFTTTTLLSPSKEEFVTAKRDFLKTIDNKTITFFHFSGHGGAMFDQKVKIHKNYMYIGDSMVIDARKLAFDIIERKPLFSIVSIDACRTGEKDLLQMDIPNTLVMLSTASNSVAYEGSGSVSPYSSCLANNIKMDAFYVDFRHIAENVQRCVEKHTPPQRMTVVSNIEGINDDDKDRDAKIADVDLIR